MCARKGILIMLLITVCYVTLSAPSLSYGDDKPIGQFSITMASQYIWRGYELSRNSVAIQPSLSIGYKGFNASLWGNVDTKPYFQGLGTDYSSEWNETDFTFFYTKSSKLVNFSVGYIYYSLASLRRDLPDRPDAQEFFFSASLNTLLVPTLTVYRDISHYKNWYILLGLSHEFELSKTFALKISGTASYLLSTDEASYPEFDDSALPTDRKFKNFHDGTVSISLPVKLGSLFTLTPAVTYIFPLSKEARKEMRGFALKGSQTPSDRDDSFIVGALTLGLSF